MISWIPSHCWKRWGLTAVLVLVGQPIVHAQELTYPWMPPPLPTTPTHFAPVAPSEDWQREPVLGRQLVSAFGRSQPVEATTAPTMARVRLFRVMPGYLTNPAGLDGPDDSARDDPFGSSVLGEGDSGPNWVQINFGDHNPYFDLRRAGDVGGLGYLRVHSQVQLLDLGSTSLCLGLQALTPAGQQSGGLNDGPTVLTPGIGLFHELAEGVAVHGYIGQDLASQTRDTDPRLTGLNCAMAVQCPVPGMPCAADRGCYIFMQALGRVHTEGKAVDLDLVPGIYWRVNESCWMSLGASRNGLFTCSWQF